MRKSTILRVAYGVAVLAALAVGWLFASGRVFAIFLAGGAPQAAGALIPVEVAGGAALMMLVGAFLFLAVRPWWWGKLLCLWPALSWMMFGGIIIQFKRMAVFPAAMLQNMTAEVYVIPLGAGATLLLVAIVHQLVDPRFRGPPIGDRAGLQA